MHDKPIFLTIFAAVMNDYYNNQQSFQIPPPTPPKEGGQRVNWVAIVSFFIPIFGLLIILNDPFDDSDWLSNIGMMLIGLGISGSILAWFFKPRWQAALGCLPAIAITLMFLIIGFAFGQHTPPRQEPEGYDSTEVTQEEAALPYAEDSVQNSVEAYE